MLDNLLGAAALVLLAALYIALPTGLLDAALGFGVSP